MDERGKFLIQYSFLAVILSAIIVCEGVCAADEPAERLYTTHCSTCHGVNRLGAIGPALLPQNLLRLRQSQAVDVITNGRVATQMPAFKTVLQPGQIDQLAQYIYQDPAIVPRWTLNDIKNSHIRHFAPEKLQDRPLFKADMMNLFIVVETGDHHATLLDGDRFEPIDRFPTRFALHGGAKFSPDGRYVYFASRDGWISKYDIYNLKTVMEIRAGLNTRNIAVSHDGRYLMVANYLPHTLVLLDCESLLPIRIFNVENRQGKSSRVSAVYTAPPRNSFIAALKDIKELWEISYADNPEPVYNGLVHDYRMKEGFIETGRFPVRRIILDDYLDDFFFDQSYQHLIGAARNGNNGQVINLIVGRKISDIAITGMPHLGSGITWQYQGKPVLATPHLKDSTVTIVDMTSWKVIKNIPTKGPGFFMRSHENSRYAWVDVFFGPHHDKVHVIDKRTLEIVKTLQPEPGKTAAHVEFTRDGHYALLSIWDNDGALIVYDADTLKEVKRIPMNKPSGKYNVFNKTHYVAGTSH